MTESLLQTRLLETTHEDFIQSLFAAALDCLEVPLRPRGQRVGTPAANPQALEAPADTPAPSMSASQHAELVTMSQVGLPMQALQICLDADAMWSINCWSAGRGGEGN